MTDTTPDIYLPGDNELMVARAAIFDTMLSIEYGNLVVRPAVLDDIIKRVVVALRWVPPTAMLPAAPAITGWTATRWWRVVLSDGTVWCESSDADECRDALRRIQSGAITTYPPGAPGGRTYAADPDARLERLYERCGREWMAER